MIKRHYIKRLYIEELICDQCGSSMQHTDMVLTSYPPQYPYQCTNKNCNHKLILKQKIGDIKYEFYEDDEMPEDEEWDIK